MDARPLDSLTLEDTVSMTDRHPASFRDPAGYVFRHDGMLHRRIESLGAEDYRALMETGLYEELTGEGLLIPHTEVEAPDNAGDAHKVIRPELVPFISHPYEWSFGQLKAAALLTLDIQGRALARGVTLKDASAYNVQFLAGRPVFIDTLSFVSHEDGAPWAAYGQFCRHFLAPLALMAHRDARCGAWLARHLDGLPLDLVSPLLPRRTWLSPGLLTHLHLHARSVRRYQDRAPRPGRVSRQALIGVMATLKSAVSGLKLKRDSSHWTNYYDQTNYSDPAFAAKETVVREVLDRTSPAVVWDLGANTGVFSRLAAASGAFVVATDSDPLVVDRIWCDIVEVGETRILPLVDDLTNSSPDLGWNLAERASLVARGPADLVMALALVHHLAIGNNVPLDRIAGVLGRLGRRVLVEFVPKSDSQVRRLLATRRDIFPDYTEEGFGAAFAVDFELEGRWPVAGSERTLFLYVRRPD